MKHTFTYSPPLDPYLKILYQDNDLVVFDKPTGLLSVRGRSIEHRDSLQARAQTVWPQINVVHRLDMATSGLLIMAHHLKSLRRLNEQFQKRIVKKTYQAMVYGQVTEQEGKVNLPIAPDWENRPLQKICEKEGKPSLTHWQVIERNQQSTRVKLTPITGRSHQLRLHMLAIGHPILGDEFYAHPEALCMSERLQLHAWKIGLYHPTEGRWMEFESDPSF